ncbi:MAG: chromosome segregation protein SMC [Clostridia bacterium]|nr:chromosome segregation protein SMC [Clostridia bacterium]
MYLKSLELQGFKSFPDKTVLHFDDGATVIVGPNGSGKSNITDAMKWVLGELSSKSIRGSRMEDVIFIGTEVRKPMSYAEVSVTFDNSSEEGRLNSPYDEITVTRRYFRVGESEYLINKQPVRLRDIYELFMNTGVGREGYSIIGQGRVAEIISKKSEDRRHIFEEAAGISKYRYKKDEAERKLKHTQENMDRVYDIFHELENRIGPLEKDAEKAKKYNELYERKKVADVSLWIYDSQSTKKDIEKTTEIYRMTSHEYDMVEDSIAQLEEQDGILFEKLQETRQRSGDIYSEIRACNSTINTLNQELISMEKNVEYAKLSSGAEIAEIEKFEAKKDICLKEIEVKLQALENIRQRLNEAQKEQSSYESEYAILISKRDNAVNEINSLFEEQKALETERDEIKVRVSIIESSTSSGNEKSKSISGEIDNYRNILDDLSIKAESSGATLAQYEASLSAMEEELTNIESSIEEKNKRYETLRDELNGLRSEVLSLEERIKALQSMEELFEGYTKSVAYIMNSYKKGEIAGAGKVYGPISTLIGVNEQYVTAIETALGVGLQHIVVDNEDTAKACIARLKANKAGRATFYPISSVSGQTPTQEMQNAKKYNGYVGVANELIKFDSKFDKIFSSLLGRTVVFDNIDNATEMARDQRYRIRVVTLDGQQINVGGSFTGGSVRHDNSMLSRSADIKRMQEEKEKSSSKIEIVKKEGQALGEALRSLTSRRSEIKQQYNITDTVYRAEKTEYETLIAQMGVNKNLIESLENDNIKIAEEREKGVVELKLLKDKKEALDERIAEISARRIELDIEKNEFSANAEEMLEMVTGSRIRVSEVNKDIESAENAVNDSNIRLQEINNEIGERTEKMQRLQSEVSSSSEKTSQNRALFEEAKERLDSLEAEHDRLLSLTEELEQKRNELANKTKSVNARKETVVVSMTNSSNKLEQLKLSFDKMVEKIYEDYGLTYTTAVALGYPEVTEENRKEIFAVATECKNKMRVLGSVNPNAIEEYKEVKERYDAMNEQITDITKARDELLKIIADLEIDMKNSFVQSFNAVNENFNQVFKELFGGGHAELSLTDPEDVLNCGIEIKAAPPGKVIKSLMLLSGGEQAFVAIALIFAILKVNPSPFCIFDEIEAALDEVNVARFGQYIKRYSKQTQFIVITHRRGTMEIADKLYGVTMPQKGISKVLTMDVNSVGKEKILAQPVATK